jgi:hypothetical protein
MVLEIGRGLAPGWVPVPLVWIVTPFFHTMKNQHHVQAISAFSRKGFSLFPCTLVELVGD